MKLFRTLVIIGVFSGSCFGQVAPVADQLFPAFRAALNTSLANSLAKFFGTSAPGSVTGNLPGDIFVDTTNHKAYICNAPSGTGTPACTSVSTAGWLLLGNAVTANPLSQFAATTSSQLAGVLSDETGGSGVAVFNSSPTIITPTIASFANATHNHTNAAGGGQLTDAALSGPVTIAKGGTSSTGAAYTAFGDSITCGTGASSLPFAYISLVTNGTGWTLTNDCVSGAELGDFFTTMIYPTTVTSASKTTALFGYNDMRHYGSSAGGQRTFSEAYKAALVWLGLPTANKVMAANATKSGSWTNNSLYTGSISSTSSSTIGNTLTQTLYGTAVYVGWTYRTNLGSGGTFTISVDGTVTNTIDSMAGVSPAANPSYWPGAARIGGLTPGPHTVVVTVTSAATCSIDWFASNDQLTGTTSPYVYVGGTPRMNATGYAAGGGSFNHGSDAITEQFNQLERQSVSQLAADGINVVYIDPNTFYNPNISADVNADNIHPSDQGHSHIANAFLEAISRLPSVRAVEASTYSSGLAQYLQVSGGVPGFSGGVTATSFNKMAVTAPATSSTLAVADGKTLTASNTLTLTGTDSSSIAFGGGGTVTYTVASGTSALGTSAIASGACATVVTTTATGTATTDVILVGFNGDPTAVTGYAPVTTGMLTIIPYPSANNVNVKVCNTTASSITPGAITLNWRVAR